MSAPAQPSPSPRAATPAVPTRCPHCKRELAGRVKLHCASTVRRTPCGWVVCSCKAIVDLRNGRHHHDEHVGRPRPSWPCENTPASAA